MFLVVGLGNPGPEYAETRHNLGFKVSDELATRLGATAFKTKHQSLITEVQLAGHKILIAQPQTFMNNSGAAVRGILAWHKLDLKDLVVVYDDVDLEVGMIRVRENGSAGGHHGIESIIASLGSTEFARVRIGIGRENLTGDVSDYVLQKIPPAQREPLAAAVITAAEALEAIISNGLTAAMNKFNGNP
jgi:PTH1 family peptidyl-tRNA hydrolase